MGREWYSRRLRGEQEKGVFTRIASKSDMRKSLGRKTKNKL